MTEISASPVNGMEKEPFISERYHIVCSPATLLVTKGVLHHKIHVGKKYGDWLTLQFSQNELASKICADLQTFSI